MWPKNGIVNYKKTQNWGIEWIFTYEDQGLEIIIYHILYNAFDWIPDNDT